MKIIILAGGLGTRLMEETTTKPKPMVEIGGRPIIWHIMKHIASFGPSEFVIALGYKGEAIKRYFLDYSELNGNLTLQLSNGQKQLLHREHDNWTIHLEDTGCNTMTGGRIKKLAHLVHDEDFMVTYGDGVSNVDIDKLIKFHRSHNRLATITAVHPPARFGCLELEANEVVARFREKNQTDAGWINGGYIILKPEALELIKGNDSSLEKDLLETLAHDKQLAAFQHEGFWQCMDTLRDVRHLEDLWATGDAPWKTWE